MVVFYDTAVASALFLAVVCWGGGNTVQDKKRLNKLVRRACSVLDSTLDSTEAAGERRLFAKLASIMDNISHLPYETVQSLSSTFSSRPCRKECYCRSFIPSAVRLYNTHCTM